MQQIRRKFIFVAMCSTFTVLAVIMGAIFLANYRNLSYRADNALDMLLEKENMTEIIKKPKKEGPPHDREVLYEPRYFLVKLEESGEVKDFRRGREITVEEDVGASYAKEILEKEKLRGFYRSFRYYAEKNGTEAYVIFVDCTRELDTMYRFFVSGIFVSALGLLLVFLLVVFFSRLVFRPVWESYKKQKQFITDASHELKTPLTIIDANTELLEMLQGENEWTESIKNQVKRLTALTEQMVMLTRMEEQEKIITEEINISRIVQKAAEPFCALAQKAGKELILSLEPEITGRGNEELLQQLVSILLDNSIKYSSDGSKIFLSLTKKGKKTVLKVSNKTEMIQKGNQDMLFERFYRTDASRNSETGGSGIGLSVAKAIVESHKGKIHGESADGKVLVITAVW